MMPIIPTKDENNVYDILQERGFIAQATKAYEIREYLSEPGKVVYCGFDPTAPSLHVGHMVPLMVMAHLQRAGHIPVALMGGGTGLIGDPSGRSDLRKVLSLETIENNVKSIAKQMSLFFEIGEAKAYVDNNAEWLRDLKFLDFLRDYGVCFSVNRMLTAECYKSRLDEGLTFLEFSYMLMQAYDFYMLYKKRSCRLQLGGDDQWSNILAGTDLIRRKEAVEAYGLTFNLLTLADGSKMGKSAAGAIWLDADMLSPFDFYQYFRNVDDRDVIKLMKVLTFIPLKEIQEFASFTGSALNPAKERLAFEVTAMIHGREAAGKAAEKARQLFSGGNTESLEGIELAEDDIYKFDLVTLMNEHDIVKSKSEGRRLINQGGIYLNDEQVMSPEIFLKKEDFGDDGAIIRRGKKKYFKFVLAK